jgi:hypothetical protein
MIKMSECNYFAQTARNLICGGYIVAYSKTLAEFQETLNQLLSNGDAPVVIWKRKPIIHKQ